MNATKSALVALSATALVACTTYRPLGASLTGAGGENEYSLTAQVAVGDTLRLTLKNGERVRVNVKSVAADSIEAVSSGEKSIERYAASDIGSIERLDVNARRTAWILGSIGAFIVIVAVAAREGLEDTVGV
jgi:predicted DNA-binding antitoxin AbrB/MazE fold protein